jgi:hydrogenase large subunit
VEDALDIQIPENANTIRNIMQLTLQVHDHIVHFYHLHALDWVDVVSALSADPKATSELAQSISSWPLSSPGYFRDLQARLKAFVDSGQLGPFRNAYWGHPAYKLPPEANLMAVAHYLEALDFQKEIVKIHTVFGGKNPHPNWMVGGVPSPINLEHTGAVGAINMERLNLVKSIIDQTIAFTEQVYVPDLLAIASFYKDWLYGGGISSKSILSYGDIPDKANDYSASSLLFPRGAIIDGDLTKVHEVNLTDPEEIQEFVTTAGISTRTSRRACTRSMASPKPNSRWARIGRARKPKSKRWTRARSTAGSSPPAGRATPWKWARSPAWSSAMCRAGRSSRSQLMRR